MNTTLTSLVYLDKVLRFFSASVLAILFRGESVFISTAASICELLTFASILLEVPHRDSIRARTRRTWQRAGRTDKASLNCLPDITGSPVVLLVAEGFTFFSRRESVSVSSTSGPHHQMTSASLCIKEPFCHRLLTVSFRLGQRTNGGISKCSTAALTSFL